nr:hypothetical protein GCM10010200_011910 [Actinomadura rugatobispora]
MADVSVEAEAPARVRPGAEVPYDVTVRNAGPDRARNVILTASLPDGAVRTDNMGDFQHSSCTRGGATVACSIGTLEASEERSMRITLRPSQDVRPGTVLRAPVRVTTSTRETDLTDNRTQVRTTVDGAAPAQKGQQSQGQQGQQSQQGRPSAPEGRPATKYQPKQKEQSTKYRPSWRD